MRRTFNTREKLAIMIIRELQIPHRIAQEMSVDDILALYQWDHFPVQFAAARDLGWPAERIHHPSNGQPLLDPDHSIKSAKQDTPQAAKDKRLAEKHREFQARRDAIIHTNPPDATDRGVDSSPRPRGRSFPSRPFPKGQRKMQSRGFQKREEPARG